jgi:hypothetical protein
MDLKSIFKRSIFRCPHCGSQFDIGPDFRSIAGVVLETINGSESTQALEALRAELSELRPELEAAELETALAGALAKSTIRTAILRAAKKAATNGRKRQKTDRRSGPADHERSDFLQFLDSFTRFK